MSRQPEAQRELQRRERASPCLAERPRLVNAATLAVATVLVLAMQFAPLAGSTSAARAAARGKGALAERRDVAAPHGHCPWVLASRDHDASPVALAAEVVARMSLEEKIAFVALAGSRNIENVNSGVPRLCIPALTLSDGPNGISNHTPRSLQMPAALALAATFDRDLARRYGEVLGAEARTKGIDVVQAPELNLARVPESGRIFEAYGEDPVLTGAMGVAEIEGIQSEGVLADAKHFTAYNQETSRPRLTELIPTRALEELYDAPFRAAVEQGHVASLMCAYGDLNGVNDCSDPALYRLLASWGFDGFVRSDLKSVRNPGAAFRAGLDLLKPATVRELGRLVDAGKITVPELDRAVRSVLAEMFAFGLIAHPRRLDTPAPAVTADRLAVALEVAERSMVLLRDSGGILPLSRHPGSVAVIGIDASSDVMSAGYGSAHVVGTGVVSPLVALRRAFARGTRVAYSPGGVALDKVKALTSAELVGVAVPPADGHRLARPVEPGKADLGIVSAANAEPSVLTATSPGRGPGWKTWAAILRVRTSGVYELSMVEYGDLWCTIDGRPVLSFPGLHGPSYWATSIALRAGVRYRLAIRWFAIANAPMPHIGLEDVSSQIAAAVRAARAAKVAVVFASDFSKEGVDRPSLTLPGDENALISAVAAANRRTIVVLNTGGAVLMPWLHQVKAVLEAWYPGQVDGTATAAVLTGAVDPSGRLPVTFPATQSETPVSSPAQYPGRDGYVDYSEGLDIGYRWYLAHHVSPLFPFGFGLSYTSFRLSHASLHHDGDLVEVRVKVKNTGRRVGTDVVQLYMRFPKSAGEPPEQLRAFRALTLRPGRSARITLTLGVSAFEAYLAGRFRTVRGTYALSLGPYAERLPITLSTRAPALPARRAARLRAA